LILRLSPVDGSQSKKIDVQIISVKEGDEKQMYILEHIWVRKRTREAECMSSSRSILVTDIGKFSLLPVALLSTSSSSTASSSLPLTTHKLLSPILSAPHSRMHKRWLTYHAWRDPGPTGRNQAFHPHSAFVRPFGVC